MLTITRYQLWAFLQMGAVGYTYVEYCDHYAADYGPAEGGPPSEPELPPEAFEALKAADLRDIVSDQCMTDNRIGGDQIVDIADQVCTAIEQGYAISTWYGEDSEALIVGYRADQLTVTD